MPISRLTWIIAVIAGGLMLGPPGAAAQTASKPYSVTLTPATIPAGETTVTATLANLTGQQLLGSADLTAPDTLTVVSAAVEGRGTATVTGRTVKLRDLDLRPGATLDVAVTVTAPCEASGPASWTVVAKQSNDFKGPPGNNLSLDPSSALTTTVAGACRLRFLTQPQDAQVDTAITGLDFEPDGPPVAVELVDDAGARVTTATGDVTLALEDPRDPVDALQGTTTVAAVDGVATFSGLRVGRADAPYALTATSPGAPPVTSDPFRIATVVTRCAEDVDCRAGVTGTLTALDVLAPADPLLPDLGLLLVSLNAGAPLDCPAYDELSADTVTVDMTSSARVKVVTLRIDKRLVNASTDNGAAGLQVCFGRPDPFRSKTGGSFARDYDGDGIVDEHIGLLGDCGAVPAPCVRSRRKDRAGDGIIVTEAPPGDPRYIG